MLPPLGVSDSGRGATMGGELDEPAIAVAELAAALGRIDGAGLDAAGRAALATAREAAATLARQFGAPEAAAPVDPVRYARLMEIAGPEGAQELLERLREDLRQVQNGLMRALAEPCTSEVRAQTHVLVALAGAVGATALQRLAEALNGAAHREAAAEMQRLGSVTLDQLGHLARFIAAQETAGRSAA